MQGRNNTVSSASNKPLKDNSGISRGDFPEDFIFGTGTSAYQVEGAAAQGGKSISVWDDFTLRTPNIVADGSNGNVACDMYHTYKEDIRLMREMGFNSYRFSISWPRILPGGRCFAGINREGIDYYNDVINTVIANGMTPFVTLFHWDLPNCLQLEYGGMLSDKVVQDFVEYADLCFQEFGDRVKFWTTLNEPWSYTVRGYTSSDDSIADARSPNTPRHLPPYRLAKRVRRVDVRTQTVLDTLFPVSDRAKDPYTVARNLLLCHAAAVQSYRTNFQVYQDGQIGIVLNSNAHYPFDSTSQADITAVKRAYDFTIGWFLEPVIYGQFPTNMLQYAQDNIVPFSDEEQQQLARSVDFVGLNYYTSEFVANDPNPGGVGYVADQQCSFTFYDKNGNAIGKPTVLDWLWIVPNGLYDHMLYLQNTYTTDMPPLYITENGVADKNDHELTAKQACVDLTRTQFYQDHLASVLSAMHVDDDPTKPLRMDVRGYFAWSFCDNFEWLDGYTVRFGIIYIDYINRMTRYMKNSALWFIKFLRGKAATPPTLEKRQVEKDSERGSKKRRAT